MKRNTIHKTKKRQLTKSKSKKSSGKSKNKKVSGKKYKKISRTKSSIKTISTYKSIQIVKSKKPLKIIAKKIFTDLEIKNKEGEFFPVNHYDFFIEEDADIYYLVNGKEKLLCSFRKKVISDKLSKEAFESLYRYAQRWHTNRGAAAGVIDSKKMPPHVERLTMKDKFRAYYYSRIDGKFHKDHVSNLARSNIIGYYDRPDRNLGKDAPPCRPTKFIRDYPDKWTAVQPFFQQLANIFKNLVPEKYKKQMERASKTPQFQIKNTPFSTATINYNWQTALHRDKGDFNEGFGNLVILERGKYDGGYIGFPQYGVLINVRQGDYLAMDVHQWHTNTDIILKTPDAARLSVVCYLREKMLRCAQ